MKTIKITANEFKQRRKKLMGLMDAKSIAILPSAPMRPRNRDVEYPFRQDSNFHYLTGFDEPEAVLVLIPGRKQAEFILFCRERNPELEQWNGFMAGQEGAIETYGADDAFPITDIDEILPGLMEGRDKVYYSMGNNPDFDKQVMEWVNSIRAQVRNGAHPPEEFVMLDHLLHDLRLFKSKKELQIMRQAGKISAEAHVKAMQVCQPGLMEFQLEAEYQYHFLKSGADSWAYPSIVGGGANACILHYIDNDQELQDGDLVLIDAGAEYQSYAGDITRTFPVNGKFSKEQRAVYDIVLAAQLAAIKAVKPGSHWNQPHEAAIKVITKGLVELGILKGDVKKLIEKEAYKPFYMHKTGHWLGLDVHDVGDYQIDDQWRMLEPGMVLTVEPGIYLSPGMKGLAKKWQGIGIRIEDDVVVTEDGCEIMTSQVPKDADEIEALMAG